jgi:hypothetical protein
MFNSDCVSTIALDGVSDELTSMIQKERVVDVEIPIKGLLLKESVVVCDCSPDQVEAQSSNISHFCTGNFNYPLFIKLNRDNKALSCRLSDLLVYSGRLILSDFRQLDQNWIDRQSDRVQPRLPIFLSVINGKKTIKANLFDLSLTGICVLLDKNSLGDTDNLLDSKLQILLPLPTSKTICNINGTVVQCRSIGDNLLRLGMNITMGAKERTIVAHYLADRKREILDELFINFTGLLNYRETKDQYF